MPAENPLPKHFYSTLHTAVFPAAVTTRHCYYYSPNLTVSSHTLLLRTGLPRLPTLSHVPAAHSRHSLLELGRPFHSCRLCASLTAHSRMAVYQGLFTNLWFWYTVIPLSFHHLPTALNKDFASKYVLNRTFPKSFSRRPGFRKKIKKESKVLWSAKCADNFKP